MWFTNYWGKGTTQELATGVKDALDAQARIKKPAGDH